MGKRIYPLKGIKYWWSYDIDEICALYKECRLHAQTVRKWIKNGLPVIKGKPTLIYGNELAAFLGRMNQSSKCKTDIDQMFCMKCQDAKSPYKKQVQIEHKDGFLKVQGVCQTCKSPMYKSYKLDVFQTLRKIFHTVDVLELYDSEDSTVKTHLDAQRETPQNEPMQMEMF